MSVQVNTPGEHKLIVHSLHDADLSCSCGDWSFTSTGPKTHEQAQAEFEYHLANVGMLQPTPGPWDIFALGDDPATYGDQAGKPIITANNHETEICGVIHNPADAPLIAAAPEMLEACKEAFILLVDLCVNGQIENAAIIATLRDTIRKATGREDFGS
jgi:hypothetical protein